MTDAQYAAIMLRLWKRTLTWEEITPAARKRNRQHVKDLADG